MENVLANDKFPLISIVVPVYKVEMFLTRCIESVLHQTYTNWELILVDDGSPDRCGDMCDAYARKDTRIFVIHQKNKGLSAARNHGMKNCHGKYLYFLDSDDYIAPETFTVLLRYALQEKAEIIMHGHYYVTSDGKAQSAVDWKPSEDADKIRKDILSNKIPNFACGKLFLRCLWDGVEFPLGQTVEDMFVLPRIFLKAERIMLVTDLLYYYCQNSGSIMNSAHLSSYIRVRYGKYLAWKEHEAMAQEYYPDLEGICRCQAVHSAVRSLFLNSGTSILSSQIQHEIRMYLFSQEGSLPFGLQCSRILILYGPQKLNCLLGKMQRAIVAYQQKKGSRKVNKMSDNKITSTFAMVVAAIITWGATADHFLKAGMSIAMIAFALYAAYTLWKRDYIKDFSIDVYIRNAFLSLYGLMIATTLFHLENMQNLIGGEISAMGLVAFTIPFWLILYVGWKKNVVKSIILSFSIWAFLVCTYGMYDYHVRNLSRLVSVYNFPTRAGCILVMCIFFTIALLWYYRKKRFQVVLYSALLGLEMISLVLTETRAAFVALVVSGIVVVGVVLFRYKQYISKRVKVLLVLALLFLTVFSAGYSVYIGRESSYRMMGEERPLIWLSTYKMWEDHKILGIGASEWKAAYAGPYRPMESREAGILSHPHNMPLYFLATGGIVGGIGYILYHVFFVMYFLKRTLKSPNDPFAWALFAIFIAYTVNGFLDATIVSKQVSRIFYLLLGVSIIFDRWHLRKA